MNTPGRDLLPRVFTGYWERFGLGEVENGKMTASLLNMEFPLFTGDELLAVSRAHGITPTALELEGWEQFWRELSSIELGLDSTSEVEQTAASGEWHQPTLPGLEEM